MAFTRKGVTAILKNEDFEDDQKLEEILKLHSEVVSGLKDDRDSYREEAEKAESLRKELDSLKAAGDKGDGFKEKYEAEHKAFEDYKASVEAEKETAATKALYREQLEELGISASRVNTILKVADIDALRSYELKGGVYAKPEEVQEAIKAEWADFIPQSSKQGASVAHPPKQGQSGAITADQFKKMSLHERNDLFKSDRETYNALAKETKE